VGIRYFCLTILSLLAVVLAAVALNEPLRLEFRGWMESRTRTVLAQAVGDLNGAGELVTVLKVKSLDTVALEIYRNDSENRPIRFKERVILDGSRDAAMKWKTDWTQLLLMDVDGEPGQEIIAPTYDLDYLPRMNIFKLDGQKGILQAIAPDSLKL